MSWNPASGCESEEIVRRFRHACVTGYVEEPIAVLHSHAELVSMAAARRPRATRLVLGADRINKAGSWLTTRPSANIFAAREFFRLYS